MQKIQRARQMTKREFIRCCCFTMGGMAIGMRGLDEAEKLFPVLVEPSQTSDELWKWSKEAEFYISTSDGLLCQKCPNSCLLKTGEMGRCRNRVNHRGKLYSIAYGNPCAVHIDPIEKKPLFHFLPSTRAFSIAAAGCNLRCLNCQNWQISQVSPKETTNFDLPPDQVVEECIRSRCESIAYTYSEPTTFYEYTLDTAAIASQRKIKNVLKSSCYINELPLRRLCKRLDAANIDLKGFDENTYAKLNGARLGPVLNALKVLKDEGVWLEITNLVIPSWTDNLDVIKRMCDWLVRSGLEDCPLHFSRFMPLYKLDHLPLTPVLILEQARDAALAAGVKYAYVGNVPGHTGENTYCHRCKKLIVERKGFTILQKFIAEGKCSFCGENIPGVWA